MTAMRLLLVDDEVDVRRLVSGHLERQGVSVTSAATVVAALRESRHASFDVVILDLTLPDGAGLDVLHAIRELDARTHVIILSGAGTEADRVRALELGADDYVVKPFSSRELVARVLSVRRRQELATSTTLRYGRILIDLTARQVTLDEVPLNLSVKEFDLLAFLAARPGHVFSRDELLRAVWQSAADWQQPSTVTEHVRRVRSKIENPSQPRLLHTVRGTGYRFDPSPETETDEGAEVTADPPAADEGTRLRHLVTGVFGELTDAVIVTDPDLHIRSWNQAAERLYGWAEHEVLGQRMFDVVPLAGDDDRLVSEMRTLEANGRWFGEELQITRDGSVVLVSATTTLLRDDDGEPTVVVSVNRRAPTPTGATPSPDTSDEADIRRGLAQDEFVVHYQPVVAFSDLHIVTVEALVRWNHPERGLLLPGSFIDAAERSGAILDLGRVVLDKAFHQTAEWRRAGNAVSVAVNLSTKQLADPTLVEDVTEKLEASQLDPAALWLEVTETALVEDLDQATDRLERLAALGIGITIDDFGTGWASLTYLKQFPIHALKIDQTFVAGIDHNPHDAAIARSIISLGDELDLIVVAEGVETVAQQMALQTLGCSAGQGYLYGKPGPAATVAIERALPL